MTPATRNDGLRLQLSGVDVSSLRIVGALAGVVVLAASARNGPGVGRLIGQFDDPATAGLSWQAPGSSTPGAVCPVPIDGAYMLEDGADPSAWVRVQVYTDYLLPAGEAVIGLGDEYNTVGPADVAAADALAGLVTTTEYTLKNVTPLAIVNVKLWIDDTASGAAGLTVSSDGTNFYDPTSPTDSHVLAWSSVAAGASVNVWVRRTIGAATASEPAALNVLQFSWTGY